jgi:hypothetical protein
MVASTVPVRRFHVCRYEVVEIYIENSDMPDIWATTVHAQKTGIKK